jgi:hypothetical protein
MFAEYPTMPRVDDHIMAKFWIRDLSQLGEKNALKKRRFYPSRLALISCLLRGNQSSPESRDTAHCESDSSIWHYGDQILSKSQSICNIMAGLDKGMRPSSRYNIACSFLS